MQLNMGAALLLTVLKNSNGTLFICTVAKEKEPDRDLSVNWDWAECVSVFAQVQKHLSKLFDNMAKMRFEADGEGNPSKNALGMYSKEEEYVPFNQFCDCTGQVKYTHKP